MTRRDLHAMLYSRFITVERVLHRQAELALDAGEIPALPEFVSDGQLAIDAFDSATYFADRYEVMAGPLKQD